MRKHQISQIFISGNRFFEFLGVFKAVKCVNIKSAKHSFPEIDFARCWCFLGRSNA